MESLSLAVRTRRPEKDQSRSELLGCTSHKKTDSEGSRPVFHVSNNQNRAYFCSPPRAFLWLNRSKFRSFFVVSSIYWALRQQFSTTLSHSHCTNSKESRRITFYNQKAPIIALFGPFLRPDRFFRAPNFGGRDIWTTFVQWQEVLCWHVNMWTSSLIGTALVWLLT